MKVLIADDSQIVRERLAYLLGDVDGVEIVGQAEDAVEAEALSETLKPDVATVIMLTNFVDPEARDMCLSEGADYFFDKSIEFDKAVEVLRGMSHEESR
jgi:DNA-binding NarL/FixJ family response regulator